MGPWSRRAPAAGKDVLERLAKEIADQITSGHGSVVRSMSSVDDIDT